MSVKVPEQTVEYQSHHHCQCDFCNSRRSVNAKKFAVSQTALAKRDANKKQQPTHDNQFDPGYPPHDNQTAINAARGRNGIPQGDQYTIEHKGAPGQGAATKSRSLNIAPQAASTRGANPAAGAPAGGKTRDEEDADALNDLDRLERLLILEHKARVQGSLDADKMASLRSGTETRPQPLPRGFYDGDGNGTYGPGAAPGGAGAGPVGVNSRSLNIPGQPGAGARGLGDTNGSGAPYGGTFNGSGTAGGANIRDAWQRAYECPIAPPASCHASYQLQQVLNDLHVVTADPVNRNNRSALAELTQGGQPGANTTRALEASRNAPGTPGAGNTAGNAAGTGAGQRQGADPNKPKTMAQLRTTLEHPQGTGVVWRDTHKLPEVAGNAEAAPRPGASY